MKAGASARLFYVALFWVLALRPTRGDLDPDPDPNPQRHDRFFFQEGCPGEPVIPRLLGRIPERLTRERPNL